MGPGGRHGDRASAESAKGGAGESLGIGLLKSARRLA